LLRAVFGRFFPESLPRVVPATARHHRAGGGLAQAVRICYRRRNRTGVAAMTRKLLTTWREYDEAIREMLALAPTTLRIFDEDLALLKLEDPARLATLRRLLAARERTPRRDSRLTIVVQNSESVRRHDPQLIDLLCIHAPDLRIVQAPDHLASLTDSLLIADDRHVLVRFERSQPRARLLIDEPAECAPYLRRFEDIVAEGGDAMSPTTFGL
jgi:hypothetical protein